MQAAVQPHVMCFWSCLPGGEHVSHMICNQPFHLSRSVTAKDALHECLMLCAFMTRACVCAAMLRVMHCLAEKGLVSGSRCCGPDHDPMCGS